MSQAVYFGVGAVSRVGRVLDQLDARRVLIVRGKGSYAASGAERALEPGLRGRSVEFFSDFRENPRFEDVLRGLALFTPSRCDAVVAVGGGTVLDMAKLLIGLCQTSDPLAAVQGRTPLAGPTPPLVAVPTTAGSGSEATHFAVVYVDGDKYSMAAPCLLPGWAVVDPELTYSLSPRATALSGIDAFTQAVESTWSVHSTSRSRAWSARAMVLALEHLPAAASAPTPPVRRAMSKAAHLAGKAINVTKTTASHALSYPLTMHYGVPHGQAVCLTLGNLLAFNAATNDADLVDPRGVTYVKQVTAEIIHLLGCQGPGQARERIRDLIRSAGLATSLEGLGIPHEEGVQHAVNGVNVERLGNNPRRLSEPDLRALFDRA